MELYIVRHAIAEERGSGEYPNDDRPLTPVGIQKMKRAAARFPELMPRPDAIYSSPLSRARETAKIVADAFGNRLQYSVTDVLLPGRGTAEVCEFLNGQKEKNNILLVGHEPDVSQLTSLLLGVSEPAIEFKKGALCALTVTGPARKGSSTLRWLLQPKHLRALGAQ